MDNKYIITPSGNFISTDELYHWGIKGMKWGIRRYQNPDGSLTTAGKKRYANPDGSLNEKGKKKFGSKTTDKVSSDDGPFTPKRKSVTDIDDAELQKEVNRLRNENTYKVLSKELGYDTPKTEIDRKIAEMEKQKKYLELQRDIKNLTPKKESKVKKLLDTVFGKVIEPAATEAGKKFLSQYLTDAATKALKKEADKTVKAAEKSVQKEKQKQEKQEKKVTKEQDRQQAKKNRKNNSNSSSVSAYDITVEGVGKSSQKTQASKPKDHRVVDADSPVTSLITTNNHRGESYVNNYRNTTVSSLPSPNIAGYLPEPKGR